MKPLDPRLLRHARAARTVLAVGGLLGLLRTAAVIAWCWLLANALAALVLPVFDGQASDMGRVREGMLPASALPWLLAGALVALIVRSASSWGMETLAARGAVRVKGQLRAAALDAIDRRSPEWLAVRPDVGPATALGQGLDALDGYFSGYVPQLILTACATPFLVLTVLLADPLSGVTVLIVFPVIPLFMILIGLATRTVQERQWSQLERLSRSFLDVVEGLTTLKIFRREQRQIDRIAREAGEYRSRTMQVLRVTFLSGFVLDLAGTFSIALVAVTVGTRLVSGEFSLALGLFVLLLLPEVFIPIRQVGAAFHASTEGLAAAERVFDLIEDDGDRAPATASDTEVSSRLVSSDDGSLEFAGVAVHRDGRAIVGPMSFAVRPGELVALAGPSGAGKSSLVSALLGFTEISAGTIGRPAGISWTGQRAGLLQGSIAANVALGSGEPDLPLVRRALDAAGFPEADPNQELGTAGAGLSGGQAQRVAVARCLYRAWATHAAALVFDEPSSALDAQSEAIVCAALRSEAEAGRAVLVVSHRPQVLAAADRVIEIGAQA